MTQPAQYISGRTVQEQMDQLIGYVDTRAAEVATDAIASDVAQVHQDMLDANADASAAAASAAAAAGTLANAVKKTGEASQSIAGDISVSGDLSAGGDLNVTGTAGFTGAVTVPAPVNNTDATTKKYVDDADALKISITGINNYAVGLTGNQTKAGQLTLTSYPVIKMGNVCRMAFNNTNADTTQTPSTTEQWGIYFADNNGTTIGALRMTRNSSKVIELLFRAYKQDGSFQSDTTLLSINQQ